MNNKVRIQDDLYEAVNGEWLAQAVIPDDKPTTGGFSLLDENVEKILMQDIEDFAAGRKKSDVTGIEDAVRLYCKVLDTARRNAEGIKPAMGLLTEIRNIDSAAALNEKAYDLMLKGVDLPIRLGVEADMKNATANCLFLMGPSIILPDTPYYGQPVGEKLLNAYRTMAARALSHTDLSEDEQKTYLEDTMAYDALISKQVKSQLEWADYVANYNPMSLAEVCDYVAPFDLRGLLTKLYGKDLPETVIAYDPKAIREMKEYFNEDNLALYVHWAYVKTLINKSSTLSEELAGNATLYRRTLMGVEKDPELKKQAYQRISRCYSEPIGVYYGRTYFGEEAKKDVVKMVKRIIEAYKGRMRRNGFLEEATKEKAIRKLSTIAIKMGYPDEVRDLYKDLTVREADSYYQAMENIGRQMMLDELGKLNKPVDRNEWLMPGHMVNACYDPSRNDITFPAAILQKPFYSLHQTVSENLGGIGAVISHEISHAFDNNGAHFDENGNLNNWWSEKDFEAFKALTQNMIEQWDGIEYCGGRVNGELVVSENIADNGGMAVTLEIMHDTEGADFQLYFINWARVWCLKATDQYIQLRLQNDVHSPAKLRANIQVRNFREWYEAFDVRETDEMFIPEDKRIIIW
ncbi:MAG: M13 family metallopeptidase [Erysipelotrichaceae bacterium]|nr:M13 family metallopeptidase [Erysipelotrichaceae bacterium]